MPTASFLSHPDVRAPGRHGARTPPWKRPACCALLAASLLVSAWLTVSMPAHSPHTGAAQQTQTQTQAPVQQSSRSTSTDTAPAVAQISSGERGHGISRTDAASRLAHRAGTFARLFFFVGLGAMLGSIIESRCWYRVFAGSLCRLARAARLPAIVGIAMPTAFASAAAADSMLVASHRKGELGNSALIAGGMLNSFFAFLSHCMRVMYPVMAAIGLTGLAYFAIQVCGAALIALGVLLVHRLLSAGKASSDAACAAEHAFRAPDPRPWRETLGRAMVRALTILFRLTCVSVPMILLMEWLIRSGALSFWDDLVPDVISQFLPRQVLIIMAAQMGGLIQSATVSAGLLAEQLITGPQVLLAMLIASAASNPVRTMRRNLPTALAIFPVRAACTIVLGMQLFRFLFSLLAAALLILWMHAQV